MAHPRIKTAAVTAATLACTLAAAVSTPAAAQDQGTYAIPSAIDRAWSMDVQHRMPRPIQVDGRWYWYLPYTITNNTGEDRLFIPDIILVTDRGNIRQAGDGVPMGVYRAIRDKLGNPLLTPPREMIRTLRQGEDFATDSVAIWPAPPTNTARMDIFFSGHSGETAPLISPSTGQPILRPQVDAVTGEVLRDANGAPIQRPILTRRTLRLHYLTPGTPPTPEGQLIRLAAVESVMR